MDDAALDPLPLSMDDPNFPVSLLLTLFEIVLQEGRNFPGKKGVEVNPVFDGNTDGHETVS